MKFKRFLLEINENSNECISWTLVSTLLLFLKSRTFVLYSRDWFWIFTIFWINSASKNVCRKYWVDCLIFGHQTHENSFQFFKKKRERKQRKHNEIEEPKISVRKWILVHEIKVSEALVRFIMWFRSAGERHLAIFPNTKFELIKLINNKNSLNCQDSNLSISKTSPW